MSSSAQVVVQKTKHLFGARLKRIEDPKFLMGTARYLDDVQLPNPAYAVFVRTPHAHARIVKIDSSNALAAPGVIAVLTASDLEGRVENMATVDWDQRTKGTVRRVLALDEVNFAGEAVALVLAENLYAARDAADLVEVEYDPLPVVTDLEAALVPGSPKVHEYLSDNIVKHSVYDYGDIEAAFRDADEIVKIDLLNQRLHPVSLETRGVAASYDEGIDQFTVWLSSQNPHGVRDELAELLRIAPAKVRLIAPDVGGGFGGKGGLYPEDAVVVFAARHIKRPVKWSEERREHMMNMSHGRGQKQHAELAVRRDGKVLGLKISLLCDGGAYSAWETAALPETTCMMATGVYDIPAFHADMHAVFTNHVPMGPYRGAGRPEAAYLIERSMNLMAAKLKLDPARVRQVNYVSKDKFPFKTPGGMIYDSGDYDGNLKKALEVADYQALRQEQRKAREEGRLVGIGLITWVEVSSFGPGVGQSASVFVDPVGMVTVAVGGNSHGQGHVTSMAQLVADELGIGLESITVQHGDTAMLPWSSITAGSRSGALGGSAVLLSARKVKEKMTRIAAHRMGVSSDNLEFEDGMVSPKGDSSKGVEFSKVAGWAYNADKIPAGMESTLYEYTVFAPPNNTFPFGTHIVMVEVDKETGVVTVLKYFAVDDCGRIINPLIVEGQIHGGIVQGLGQALLEEILYDENGQLLTATLADYAIPSAVSLPNLVCDRTETTTYANPLGVKGIGEGGTIAATPAIMSAIEDALSSYNILLESMPARPDYIKSLMKG